MSRIGAKVKSARTSKGLTQKQLGKVVGVSEGFIEDVESGKRVLNDELIKKISKALSEDITDRMMSDTEEKMEVEQQIRDPRKIPEEEIQKVWNDAFETVLKTIPVYEYNLTQVVDKKQLPVISNKIEGYPKDKVVYLKIQDNDMVGFRIAKDDIAFVNITREIENNSIYLVEYKGQRTIRQIKRLNKNSLLLVYNDGILKTETVEAKDLKVLARLIRLEIKL